MESGVGAFLLSPPHARRAFIIKYPTWKFAIEWIRFYYILYGLNRTNLLMADSNKTLPDAVCILQLQLKIDTTRTMLSLRFASGLSLSIAPLFEDK